MNWLKKKFLTGLVILLPTVVTVYVFYRLFRSVDSLLKPLADKYPVLDIPGLGFVGVVLIILITGVFAGNLIGRTVIGWFEGLIEKIPMISRIYIAIKQISEVFFKPERTVFKEAILVEYPRPGIFVIGFVTSYYNFKDSDGNERRFVNVFLPTTPNPTSGLFLMVPEEEVTPMNCTMEDALKMVISGGAVLPMVKSIGDISTKGKRGS